MIGDKIKELRKARMLTQAQMAEQTGININTLASYERNIREPSIDVISILCEYFKVSADYLLGLSPYQDKAHSKTIDSLFQGLPVEIQNHLAELQMSLLQATEVFNDFEGIFGELFRCMDDDIQRCIRSYIRLIDDQTIEINWGSQPGEFVDRFLYDRAMMSQNISGVIQSIYERGNIGFDKIVKTPAKKSWEEKDTEFICSSILDEKSEDKG